MDIPRSHEAPVHWDHIRFLRVANAVPDRLFVVWPRFGRLMQDIVKKSCFFRRMACKISLGMVLLYPFILDISALELLGGIGQT